MKNSILLLTLITLFACCTKEDPAEEVNILPSQPVYYTVEAQDTLPKTIHIELWSVKQGTKEKSELVAQIDTVVSIHQKMTFTLLQDVKPVIYCIASLSVKANVQSDFMNIEIGSNKGMRVRRATGCVLDEYELSNAYISLY